MWSGVGALIAGSVVVFLMQGPYASGGSVADALDPSSISFSLGTRFGQAVVARIVLTAAFALLLARGLRVPAALCGVALIFTWTLVDHSRTGVQTWLGVPAASVHLLAMALWFGGLVVVLVCGEAAPIARFSRVALVCFGALGVTGVYLAYRQSGELGALPATVFGRLLLVKTGVVIAILALAYFSRRAVQRRSTPRRTVAGEAFLGHRGARAHRGAGQHGAGARGLRRSDPHDRGRPRRPDRRDPGRPRQAGRERRRRLSHVRAGS